MKKIIIISAIILTLGVIGAIGTWSFGRMLQHAAEPSFVYPPSFTAATKEIPAPALKKEAGRVEERPDSFLQNLEILGTFILDNEPKAIIREVDLSRVGLYGLRDKIKRAEIIEITLYKVVFLKGQKRHTLWIRRGLDAERPIQELSPYYRVVNKAALAQEAVNINQVFKEANFIPFIQGGKITGMKITRLEKQGILAKTGLKENDVIKSANGITLNSLEGAFKLLEKVRTSDIFQIDLEIERSRSSRSLPQRQILTYTVF